MDMTGHQLAMGILHFQALLAARMISGIVKVPDYDEMIAEIEQTIQIYASKVVPEE